jgi:hypothetical protein
MSVLQALRGASLIAFQLVAMHDLVRMLVQGCIAEMLFTAVNVDLSMG